MVKSIEVSIEKDGAMTVHSQGFSGKTCLIELAKFLAKMKALGLDTEQVSQQLTDEAYQTVQHKDEVRLRV